MLVLSRFEGESIMLYCECGCTRVKYHEYVGSDRRKIRLAFDGPQSVIVLREEIDLNAPASVRRRSKGRNKRGRP
jgi:sRNA-binding carbon storage regulator CsrA